jgi:hypothetical protein
MVRWFVTIVIVCAALSAVPAEGGPLSFGLKAGLDLSSITETPEAWSEAKSFKPGLTAGAVMIYAWDNGFGLQPELLYAQKGVSASLYEGLVDVGLDLNLSYIEIPLLAVYTFPLEGKFKPYVQAGPSVAFTLSSELVAEVGILSGGVDFSSLTHVTDWGIVLGGGFGIETGSGTITFDARYTRGFTNVILSGDFEIDGSTQTIEGDDFKNHGMAFLIGYIF